MLKGLDWVRLILGTFKKQRIIQEITFRNFVI